jgi:hypothetical protein
MVMNGIVIDDGLCCRQIENGMTSAETRVTSLDIGARQVGLSSVQIGLSYANILVGGSKVVKIAI